MQREEVIKTVNHFLVEEIEIEEGLLTEGALLKEDLGIDSLDFVDIVVIVDKKFGFKIRPEELAGIVTLNDFCSFIEKKVTK